MTDITKLAQRMKTAAEKATQGEWWADEVKNEGCYGSGDDCVEGFTSYAIYGSDGQTLFDSLNSDAACICEEYDGEGHVAWDETAQSNAEFIALANPNNVIALVEALETEKRICATWRKTAESTSEKLEKAQAGEKQWREVVDAFCADDADWHKLTNSNNELIALLSQALCKQADRIAELESRAVTVGNLQESSYRAGLTAGWNLGLANNNDGFNKCLAAHAAGIKVEAE
ncbi:TPA: ead/Ea22-like family protein [Klebsiella pneumoniae]|uniref:ead/Ea22-like family protein n=2 Tax=Klebsiella pneumoniae TaxID=573 RepID=UPI0004504C0B|nr:ead/Ea22-like family protein [Klebsiella pneumoniae]HDT1972052.1 ead/Ea22-like family protein [Klebsiella pneumoniae subsp. pneumoniae]EIW3883842.1 ead/Ea22-like family protein [Klebsiella pneumoniae]EIW8601748.1 ead/Ea22-like family protein [Klebsiella pneumoniae]EIX9363641.1 ead/Ea22-like family protein [Klebsiella pneumoniae]EKC7835486.1 ead/Ea22-like family protein [Klebsiella pneumoniae]